MSRRKHSTEAKNYPSKVQMLRIHPRDGLLKGCSHGFNSRFALQLYVQTLSRLIRAHLGRIRRAVSQKDAVFDASKSCTMTHKQ